LQLSILGPTFVVSRTLDAPSLGILELAEVSDDSLARPSLRAMGLDQRPIRVPFAVLSSVARPDEHARIVRRNPPNSTAEVFTTSPFQLPTSRSSRETNKPDKLHSTWHPRPASKKFQKIDSPPELWNLG